MTRRAAFIRGVLAGCCLMAGAHAVHWLLTPAAHPDASATRELFVWVQLLLCGVGIPVLMHGVPGEVEQKEAMGERLQR